MQQGIYRSIAMTFLYDAEGSGISNDQAPVNGDVQKRELYPDYKTPNDDKCICPICGNASGMSEQGRERTANHTAEFQATNQMRSMTTSTKRR